MGVDSICTAVCNYSHCNVPRLRKQIIQDGRLEDVYSFALYELFLLVLHSYIHTEIHASLASKPINIM